MNAHLLVALLTIGAVCTGAQQNGNSSSSSRDDEDEVETNLQFYMHDNILVPNPSGILVAGPNGSTTVFTFGTVIVIDDALTQGESPSSTPVGRGQGTYLVSSLDASSVLLTFTGVFSQINGTLSFHGADKITAPSREISVVGGTGIYRFARGYAVITTVSTKNFSAVLHFNVTIRVSNSTGVIASTSPGQSSLGSPSSAAHLASSCPLQFLLLLVVSHIFRILL